MARHSCGYEARIHCKKCGSLLTYKDRAGLYCPNCGRRVTTVCPGCGKAWT
ncbi:MAG: DNA helicase PriA [Methanomicrobiales archaeon]|nr:DNA helicase PriA [Methanomicrobiales archaeon]